MAIESIIDKGPVNTMGSDPIVTIKNSLNTRVTYSAVFNYNRSELEKRGILDVAEFTRIIRAHQAREQRARQKSAAKHNTKRGENGIMSSMKNRANSALALTLAIACAVAAPLRSDARSGSCGCGESRQPLAKQAFRGACPSSFRARSSSTPRSSSATLRGGGEPADKSAGTVW